MINEPHIYQPGQWRQDVDKRVASGHFRLALTDGPFALLELTGQP